MRGKVLIDGVDIYSQYGVFVGHDGYNDIVCYPSIKQIESVDYPEMNGSQFDLSDIKLTTKEFSIDFVAHRVCDTVGLIRQLSDGAYHDFVFYSIGATKRLRLLSQPNLKALKGLEVFKLQFADDFPLSNYIYVDPIAQTDLRDCGFALDGRSFKQYDLMTLEGAMAEIIKLPNVKKNLTTSTSAQHGSIYDGATVRYDAKEVKLPCYMRSTTIEGFWRNHYALLFDLIRPDKRQLTVSDRAYPCYYKNCQCKKFYVRDERVWWEFDLTLCFIR